MKRFMWSGALFLAALHAAATARARAPDEPLSCSTTDALGTPPTLNGAATPTDPTHKGHLRPSSGGGPQDMPSTCGVAGVAPAVEEPTLDFHYRAHAFRNWLPGAACVTVQLYWRQCDWNIGECAPPPNREGSCAEGSCGGVGFHEATAYAGAFDPADIRSGFLGDTGRNAGGPGQDRFSFDVPAGSDFTVVVTWAGPVAPAYQPHYAMYVTGCGQAPPVGADAGAGVDAGGDAGVQPPPPSGGAGAGADSGAAGKGGDGGGGSVSNGQPDGGAEAGSAPVGGTVESAGGGDDGGCNASGHGGNAAALALGALGLAVVTRRRRR
jgi:uncharacterized protein (TIGR03382 family)